MKTSERGIATIKRNEGFTARVYSDVGKQAIGYGHDLTPQESFAGGVSMEEADALLRKDLATRYEPAVNALVPEECTQNQFDALVDFTYNLGSGALKMMLSHGWSEVPVQMLRWVHVSGVENAGLKARRQAEVALFVSET